MRLRPFAFCCHWQRQNSSAVKAGALRAQLFNLIKKRYLIVSLFGSSSKARTCDITVNSRALYQLSYWGMFNFKYYIFIMWCRCDIHSFKLICFFFAIRKAQNKSLCAFESSLLPTLSAFTFSAVNSRALYQLSYWGMFTPSYWTELLYIISFPFSILFIKKNKKSGDDLSFQQGTPQVFSAL